MRIALVSQEYPLYRSGGIATQTHAKAHGLAALGHDVVVLTHGDGSPPHEFYEGRVRVVRVPASDDRMPIATEITRWLTYSMRVAETIAAIQRQQPLDLIDFPEWGCEGYVHLLNQTSWNAVPTVIQLHGPIVMFADTMGWPDQDTEFYRQGSAMEASCLRLADAIYSSSRCSARWCAEHYGMDADKIPVMHTGVDTEFFRPSGERRAGGRTIIFVGKLVENKGVILLLRAALQLAGRYPGLRLRMLGGGEAGVIERLRREADEAGLPGLLELPGRIAREKLPAELAAADIFAAPSVYEGGPGFVYLEAMACGLPVIACQGSGASEVITEEETGFLVPPDDVDQLAAVLCRLLEEEDLRRRLGENARRYAEAHADQRICLQQLEHFYTSVSHARTGNLRPEVLA